MILNELILIKKKNPKLEIRIIIDAFTKGLSPEIIFYLEKSGIQIKEFHPLPKIWLPISHLKLSAFLFSLKNFNKRMHDKFLIIDRNKLLLGGRNIEESYFGQAENNFYDREVIIESRIAAKSAAEYFENIWNSKHVKSICPAIDYSKRRKYQTAILEFHEFIKIGYDLERKKCINKINESQELCKSFPVSKVSFLNSFCKNEGDINPEILSFEFFNFLQNCRKEIIIETPYLICPKALRELLRDLRNKGVRVVFITNSYCSTDVSIAAAAYDIRKAELLEMGIELFEYNGPGILHSKCSVVDRKIGFIGSFNLDPRSISTNTETMISFEGPEAIGHLLSLLENDMHMSTKIEFIDGNIEGQILNCNRTFIDTILYILFLSLSNWTWIYAML